MISRYLVTMILWLVLLCNVAAQSTRLPLLSLRWPDSLYPARFWSTLGGAAGGYGLTMTGLWQAWYADYPTTKFHTFNDNHEWQQMDKMGHWLMSYQESRWIYHGARWTGIPARKAAWVGFAGGQLVQTSFEIFDGFSDQWGFSWGDIGFNTLGASLFLSQQLAWNEQRITMKMSAMPVKYSNNPVLPYRGIGPPITLQQRADELYGTGPVNLFLKNYNTLVVWASVNPRSFMGDRATWLPRWLNLAVGKGANNLFAGAGYEWQPDKNCTGPDCPHYQVDPAEYPRTRQWFLSFDVDLARIPVKNRALRTLLVTANIFKIPSPTLEWRQGSGMRFHPLYF